MENRRAENRRAEIEAEKENRRAEIEAEKENRKAAIEAENRKEERERKDGWSWKRPTHSENTS